MEEKPRKIHWIIAFLSLPGLILSAYLTYGHYSSSELICSEKNGFSCNAVINSEYSEIFGFPIAILGVIGYLLIFFINLPFINKKIFFLENDTIDVHTFTLALIGIIFTVYFNYLQLFIIGAICVFCEISALLMLLITSCSIYSYFHCKKRLNFINKMLIFCVIILIILLSWSITPKPLDDFSKCISNKGAVLYGTWWCSHCAMQKELFSSSFKYINYVECSDLNMSKNELCDSLGIKNYPTWIFDKNKRIEGQLSLKQLSELTNCSLK